MGVKIRKEDSARIHGDHLRYKGRRSVFPPLYLFPPCVPVPYRVVLYLYTYIYIYVYMCACDVRIQRTYVHMYPLPSVSLSVCLSLSSSLCLCHGSIYVPRSLYTGKRIYRCTRAPVRVRVYRKHVYRIVLNPLTYNGLSLREMENFPRRALVKFSIFLAPGTKSVPRNLHL